MTRRPEILAPAGDDASLQAALAAGADAVYFGVESFNARARATNFASAKLESILNSIHERGAKGYLTMNTLVFDDELGAVEMAIRSAANAGVDALIVQDLGLLKLAKAIAPQLPIHASTQMTCTDAASVQRAVELGAERVILARELSLEEISKIREQTSAPLEVFVHGALCVAYSGQCLTSEAIGGRSANRGACAQACRLPYRLVVDGEVQQSDAAHLLSPEDLETSAQVGALMELGISSLKIEGRLKGSEYVASAVQLYKGAVDAFSKKRTLSPELRTRALQTYSRGSGPGFLAGLNHQRLVDGRNCDHRGLLAGHVKDTVERDGKTWIRTRLRAPLARGAGVLVEGGFSGKGEVGGRVWLLEHQGKDVEHAPVGAKVSLWLGPKKNHLELQGGRRLFQTDDPQVDRSIRQQLDRDPHREGLHVRVGGHEGGPLWVHARSERGLNARVQSERPLAAAENRPLTEALLQEKIGQLGATPYRILSFRSELSDGVILPLSALKKLKRALVDALKEAAQRAWPTTSASAVSLKQSAQPPKVQAAAGGLFVLCRNEAQAMAALSAGADGIYLDFLELSGTKQALLHLRAQGAPFVGLAPPRIRKPGEEKTDRYLKALAPDAMLVRGLGALSEPFEGLRIGDFSLNVSNRLSASTVMEHGLSAFTPSFDLNAEQLMALLRTPFGPFAELVIHHPMPLFHMEHCVFAAMLSKGKDWRDCGRPCDRHKVALQDRAGMQHPLEADVGCRNTVFHAASQSAAELIAGAQEAGVQRFRVELVQEEPSDVQRIVKVYRSLLERKTAPKDVYQTLRTEGGYGVVRGSLRVL